MQWYMNTVEGTFSFWFLSVIKQADLQQKLELYHQMLPDCIAAVKINNTQLGIFLEGHPEIQNPPAHTLMQTSYQAIPELLEKLLKAECTAYQQRLDNITNNVQRKDTTPYLKYGLMLCVSIGACLYALYYFNNTAVTVKQGLKLLGTTQEKTALICDNAANTAKHLQEIESSLIGAFTQIKTLATHIETLEKTSKTITTIINSTIRPTLALLYTQQGANLKIIKEMNTDAYDFLTVTSKLIFK